MIKKITLYIGLNDKDTKTQQINTLDAYKIINNIIKDSTIVEGRGVYTHENGYMTTETTLIITVLDFNEDFNIKATCDILKMALNQESIAVSEELINSQLY